MGYAGKNGVRTSDKQECQEILDIFFKYGNEVDTARMYGEGTTEQVSNHFILYYLSKWPVAEQGWNSSWPSSI
jgi:aryl-alcohol dehydrogenase-like predicted oxidoreductase